MSNIYKLQYIYFLIKICKKNYYTMLCAHDSVVPNILDTLMNSPPSIHPAAGMENTKMQATRIHTNFPDVLFTEIV
jgi:hypothetical protein